jgi:biotin carboxylase
VPGAGYGGAEVLRDKHLLRLVSAEAGIRNPRSVPVTGPDEVRARLTEWGTVVLKPANRQAAVGTRVLSDPAAVEAAWADCTDQDEGIYQPDRGIEVRMLVEEYVRGREFSVELMSTHGRRVFGNVTAKELYPGDRPIEIGHTVPADLPAELTERLLVETERCWPRPASAPGSCTASGSWTSPACRAWLSAQAGCRATASSTSSSTPGTSRSSRRTWT